MSQTAKQTLVLLAAETGDRPQQVLDKALESYRRRLVLERANEAFAEIRADRRDWAAEVKERALWDGATSTVED